MKEINPSFDEGMFKGAPASSFEKAVVLRINETIAEKILWEKLRNKQLLNLKFRRQHPVNIYILDFYCHKLKLGIELDGVYHFNDEQIQKDLEGTEVINSNELEIIRFTNDEIINNLSNVLEKISQKANSIINNP